MNIPGEIVNAARKGRMVHQNACTPEQADDIATSLASAAAIARENGRERSQGLIDCSACLADHYGLPAGAIEHNHAPGTHDPNHKGHPDGTR